MDNVKYYHYVKYSMLAVSGVLAVSCQHYTHHHHFNVKLQLASFFSSLYIYL